MNECHNTHINYIFVRMFNKLYLLTFSMLCNIVPNSELITFIILLYSSDAVPTKLSFILVESAPGRVLVRACI